MCHFDISRLSLCEHPLNLSGFGSTNLRLRDQYVWNDYLPIRLNSPETLRMIQNIYCYLVLARLSLIFGL